MSWFILLFVSGLEARLPRLTISQNSPPSSSLSWPSSLPFRAQYVHHAYFSIGCLTPLCARLRGSLIGHRQAGYWLVSQKVCIFALCSLHPYVPELNPRQMSTVLMPTYSTDFNTSARHLSPFLLRLAQSSMAYLPLLRPLFLSSGCTSMLPGESVLSAVTPTSADSCASVHHCFP